MKNRVRLKPVQSFFLLLLTITVWASALIFAQPRPKLKAVSRDYFAGKFLLIPRDERPSSLLLPRLVSEVADHDLVTPPARLLNSPEQIIRWVKTIDLDEIDGAIVSFDSAPGTELIKQIRSRRRMIPIYGFINLAGASSQSAQSAIDPVAGGSLDFLSIGIEKKLSEPQRAALLTKLRNEIDSRKLGGKISLNDDADATATALLTRMINSRFGLAPKVLPVYSSNAGRDAIAAGYSVPLAQMVGDKIRRSGGIEISQTAEGARGVEIILFIHTPRAREPERVAFIEAIAQTIDRNVRIALVDLSETKEERDAIIAGLRRRKLVDKLAAYASFDPATEKPGEAVTRALGQATSFLISIRFLRDDLERVRRFDRAQVSLLFSRYLTDWIFPFYIRPKLNGESARAIQNPDEIETFALNEIKPVADELFDDQFKRNVHTFLLSNGERAQIEVRLMQRLLLRLHSRADAPQVIEAEVKPSIYLVHLGNFPVPQLRSDKQWRVFTDGLDERVSRRWDAIDWPGFKTDSESVEMAIKVAPPSASQPDLTEGYTIVSKRSRNARRFEITAPTPQGAFYALGKLEQMGFDGQLIQDFQINEKPAASQRGIIENFSGAQWSHRDRMEMIRFLGRIRMNFYYHAPKFETERNQGAPLNEDEKIGELLSVADENFVQFVYGFRLSSPIPRADDQLITSITDRIEKLLTIGVRRFAILIESAPGEKQSAAVQKMNSEQVALVNRIRERMGRSGEFELSVLPDVRDTANSHLICLSPKPSDWSILDETEGSFTIRPISQFHASKPAIAMAAEYAWSGRGYNQDRAFNSTLNLLYDERSQSGVRVWSQALGDCRSSGNPSVSFFDQNGNAGANEPTSGSIKQKLAELQNALEVISGTRERGLLRGELAQLIARAQLAIEKKRETKQTKENETNESR